MKTAYELRISDWISDVCSSDLSLRLVLLHRAPDPLHRPLADQVRVPALARPGFADTDTAQRRVDVERVAADALAELAMLAVEQVGRDDLEVVVRGVRERAAAVAARKSVV